MEPRMSTRKPTPAEIQAFRDGWLLADTLGLQGRRVEAGLTALFAYLEKEEAVQPREGDRVRVKPGALSVNGVAIGGATGVWYATDESRFAPGGHIAALRLDRPAGGQDVRNARPTDLERLA